MHVWALILNSIDIRIALSVVVCLEHPTRTNSGLSTKAVEPVKKRVLMHKGVQKWDRPKDSPVIEGMQVAFAVTKGAGLAPGDLNKERCSRSLMRML